MFQVRNSLKRNLIFLSTLLVFVAKAQDTLILEEVQTYYLNGTIKSIEEFKFNKAEKVTRFSKYETSDNSLYIVDTEYDSLNRTIKEESIIDNKVIKIKQFEFSSQKNYDNIKEIYHYKNRERK